MEAGIDWVSWVEAADDTPATAAFLGQELMDEAAADGGKVTAFSFEGYRGWQCAGAAFGSRADSVYLRLSGSQAGSKWTRLRSSLGHPTRLDVQCSFWLTEPRTRFGSQFLRQSEASSRPSPRKQSKRTITRASDGAYCGAVGSRISRRYIRVYDKGVEQRSHEPGVWWRYEVEAKRDLAPGLWSELTSAENPTEWCVGCCARSSFSAGLRWPSWLSKSQLPLPPESPRVPADVASSLKWLREQVRPTINRLTLGGHGDEAARALGLRR